jgi:hypothetical protein
MLTDLIFAGLLIMLGFGCFGYLLKGGMQGFLEGLGVEIEERNFLREALEFLVL